MGFKSVVLSLSLLDLRVKHVSPLLNVRDFDLSQANEVDSLVEFSDFSQLSDLLLDHGWESFHESSDSGVDVGKSLGLALLVELNLSEDLCSQPFVVGHELLLSFFVVVHHGLGLHWLLLLG